MKENQKSHVMMMSLTFSGLPVCCDTARNNTCIHCIMSLCYWSPWWAETNAVTKISQHPLIVLLFIYWSLINSAYLRQCVIDVFCSTSTDRSRKSSSLLLTWNKSKGRTPKVTWCVVMNWTQVQTFGLKSSGSVTLSPICLFTAYSKCHIDSI